MDFTSCIPGPLLSPSSIAALHHCNLLPKEKSVHSGSCTLSQCVTQSILLPKHLYLQMFTEVSHWSGSRPLNSTTLSILDPHQDSSQVRCPVVALSHRDPQLWSTGPDPSHVPAGHRWSGPTQRTWALVVAESVSLPAHLHLPHQDQLWLFPSTGQTSSPSFMPQGQLYSGISIEGQGKQRGGGHEGWCSIFFIMHSILLQKTHI